MRASKFRKVQTAHDSLMHEIQAYIQLVLEADITKEDDYQEFNQAVLDEILKVC